MKKLIIWTLCAIGVVTLGGCESREEKAINMKAAYAATQKDAEHPEVVATLPDGREIQRIQVTAVPSECDTCDGLGRPHWVYFVGETVTVNRAKPSGKTTHMAVEVTINGQKMSLDEAKANLADEEKRIREFELKNLKELQAKYGEQK